MPFTQISFSSAVELFQMFEPLVGKKSIQNLNGPGARKKRQLMDRSFSHGAVKDYYEHFVMVNISGTCFNF